MHTNHFNGPELLLHMGAHILHGSQMKDADNPCGLCLNHGSLYAIRLVQQGKSGDQVDMAAKFSKTSLCTNIPIWCPLCPKVSDAIWKYNLRSHITKVHGGDISLYQDLYTAAFLSKPWKTRRKKAAQNSLKILEAHSTHVALSAMLPIDKEDDDPDNDEDPHGLDHASEDGYADSIHQPLTPTSSEEDPAELLTQSLTPASYFAHSPINTPPICSMKSSRIPTSSCNTSSKEAAIQWGNQSIVLC
ncbi:hypothetical protein L208DRAFT_1380918 [Tricholoma matsutake]|nr:hypothetical protein L208DRAFT_1380918 [Tricholoma matsutake 945]